MMAIEISEISIRMAVGDAAPTASPDAAPREDGAPDARDIDELVRRCVREVLAALRLAGDR